VGRLGKHVAHVQRQVAALQCRSALAARRVVSIWHIACSLSRRRCVVEIVAIAVVLVYLAISTWALRARPGNLAAEDFLHVWRFSPWGKQFMVDFYCLEVVVGLWMVSHAMANDTLLLAVICLALMPILGALSPAVYFLVAG